MTHGEDRVGRDGQILIPKEISNKTGLFHLGWEMENESGLVDAIQRLKRPINRSLFLPTTNFPIAFTSRTPTEI